MPKSPTQMILASGSPRRIELLRSAGFDPKVMKPEVDETPQRGESPRAMVRRLARAKARAVADRLIVEALAAKPTIVIAADTTVVSPDGRRILGKPRDSKDALRMLGTLSGKTHSVLTGYCIIETATGKGHSREWGRVVSSRVRMKKSSRSMLLDYVKTEEPVDKAGAYAIQGLGGLFVESVSGSFTNVVGLPMAQLLLDLEKHFGLKAQLKQPGSSHDDRT
jgi:septum formation protein